MACSNILHIRLERDWVVLECWLLALHASRSYSGNPIVRINSVYPLMREGTDSSSQKEPLSCDDRMDYQLARFRVYQGSHVMLYVSIFLGKRKLTYPIVLYREKNTLFGYSSIPFSTTLAREPPSVL